MKVRLHCLVKKKMQIKSQKSFNTVLYSLYFYKRGGFYLKKKSPQKKKKTKQMLLDEKTRFSHFLLPF